MLHNHFNIHLYYKMFFTTNRLNATLSDLNSKFQVGLQEICLCSCITKSQWCSENKTYFIWLNSEVMLSSCFLYLNIKTMVELTQFSMQFYHRKKKNHIPFVIFQSFLQTFYVYDLNYSSPWVGGLAIYFTNNWLPPQTQQVYINWPKIFILKTG